MGMDIILIFITMTVIGGIIQKAGEPIAPAKYDEVTKADPETDLDQVAKSVDRQWWIDNAVFAIFLGLFS